MLTSRIRSPHSGQAGMCGAIGGDEWSGRCGLGIAASPEDWSESNLSSVHVNQVKTASHPRRGRDGIQ